MGSAKRTAVLFALAWCLLFSLHSRVTSGLYPGAIQIGWKALLALALSPLLLRLLGDYALRGPVLAGARPLALQRRGAQAQRRGMQPQLPVPLLLLLWVAPLTPRHALQQLSRSRGRTCTRG